MLKEGYFADPIISDEIDQIKSAQIKGLEVELTMVDGKIVYKKIKCLVWLQNNTIFENFLRNMPVKTSHSKLLPTIYW